MIIEITNNQAEFIAKAMEKSIEMIELSDEDKEWVKNEYYNPIVQQMIECGLKVNIC